MAEEQNLNPQIIVSVGVDASGAGEVIDGVKSKLDGLNNVDTSKSVKTLKQELREATNEAQKIGQQFGRNSQEFANAAKKVAELKDEMSEFQASVEAFNPDNKLQALASLGRGAVGAIQGVTGAMAFLGVESEDAAQTIAKLQGLMAFSEALNNVDDMKVSFNNLKSVLGFTKKEAEGVASGMVAQEGATKGATVAAKGFGTAFKAIGIGLIVSAIAYLVSNFDSLKETVVKAVPALGNLGEIFNKVKAIAFGVGNTILKFVTGPIKAVVQLIQGDFSGALDTIKGMANVTKNFQEGYNNEIKAQAEDARKEQASKEIENTKNQIEILKARGKDTYALEKENFKRRLSLVKEGSDEYKKIQQEEAVFEAGHQKDLDDKRKTAADKVLADRKAAAKKLEEQLKSEREKLKQHEEELLKITEEAQKNTALAKLNDKDKELAQITNDFNDRQKHVNKLYQEDLAMLQRQLKDKQITQKQFNDSVLKLNQDNEVANTALMQEKGQKELDVTTKYNKLISDFVDQYQQTAYERQREKLIEDFDAKIAVADEKQKVLLEKLKGEAVDDLDRTETLRKETINQETNLIDTQVANAPSDDDTPEQRIAKLDAVYQAEKEWKEAKFQEELEKLNGEQEAIRLLTAQHNKDILDNERANSEAKKAISKAEKDARISDLQSVGQALNTIGELVGKQTAVGKALAVAQATIDTYAGASKALAQGGFAGIAMAAAVVATGIMNVKKILSTQIPGKGDGGGGTAPVITTAPVVNTSLTAASTGAVQDVRVTNQQDQVVKAYVTDRDLKDNEEKSNFLNKLSTV